MATQCQHPIKVMHGSIGQFKCTSCGQTMGFLEAVGADPLERFDSENDRQPDQTQCFELDGVRVQGDPNMSEESLYHLKKLIEASEQHVAESPQPQQIGSHDND